MVLYVIDIYGWCILWFDTVETWVFTNMKKRYTYLMEALVLGWLFFNRHPNRTITSGNNIVSPADGTIVDITGNRIEIFIGLTDVHYQRIPAAGTVIHITDMNREYNLIELDTSFGIITVERWAGKIARTVTTDVKVGDTLNKGDTIGRIVLGSHTSITIPLGLTIKVAKDQHVFAGETIIAE